MELRDFQSFDEFAAALGHSDLRLIALGRERTRWRMGCCTLDGLQVRMSREGGPNLMDVSIAADGVALAIGFDAAGKITGNGSVFGPESVMVIPSRTEVRSVSLEVVSWCSVFIPAARLYEPGDEPGLRRRLPVRVVDPPAADCAAFRGTLEKVAAAALSGAFEASLAARCDASRRLIAAAREVLGVTAHPEEGVRQAGRQRIPRAEIIRRAHDWIDRQGSEPITLDELALATRVSARTLHNAFHEQFGLSPKRFLRLRQLNAARAELRQADPTRTRVADVMARLGVWEWGRFSSEYRALFGELPSQTLQSRVRRGAA